MKKLIAAILALCLVFTGFISYKDHGGSAFAESKTEQTEQAPQETETVQAPSVALDFDALYAAHAPEDVIMDVNGELITWNDYYFYLYMQANQMASNLQQMAAYYGVSYGWEDVIDDDGTTVSALTTANSVEMFRQYMAIEKLAEEKGISLTDEQLAAVSERIEADVKAACGDEGTVEQFAELLAKEHISPADFEHAYKVSMLYTAAQNELYGKNGSKVSDEDAMKFMEDYGYLCATHILFATIDTSTREPLDEASAAEKKAKAEEVSAQLRAITDEKELVETFAKLKEELCDDTGKVAYPDGYVFMPGEMVPEFENAVASAENYKVTEPVESSYGYHVIMRLPLDVDMVMGANSDGSAITGRSTAAGVMYADELQAVDDSIEIVYKNGYVAPKLDRFVK